MIDRSTGRRLRLTAGAAALLIALTACGSPSEPAPPAAPEPEKPSKIRIM